MTAPPVLVVGVGNAARGDDGAGIVAAARLAETLPPWICVVAREGDLLALVDELPTADLVIIIDATVSGARAGTIRRMEARDRPLPAGHKACSSHALGVGRVVEIARALGRLPSRLVVYGIEGRDFRPGEGLSPPVETAVEEVVRLVIDEVA
jgi:hydrogenase maturation protease